MVNLQLSSFTSFTANYLDVSTQIFSLIETARDQSRRGFRLRRFEAKSRILIITIPTGLHETLHREIYNQYYSNVVQRGLRKSWKDIAATTLRAQGHPRGDGGNGGEADSAGGPYPQRAFDGDWPTLVVEAGVSETLPELRRDMRWWFSTSNHQVKIVLLAKFEHTETKIILEKWVERPPPPRQGATTTRRAAMLEPWCDQEIFITRNPGITDSHRNRFDPESFTVTRGALRLEFNLLFLREPIQEEGDVIISVEGLQDYASVVWTSRPGVLREPTI
jgi:hypothetical protein